MPKVSASRSAPQKKIATAADYFEYVVEKFHDHSPEERWERLAKRLKEQGWVSNRTGQPLTPNSLRLAYFRESQKRKQAATTPKLKMSADPTAQIKEIQKVLAFSTIDDATKLKLIYELIVKPTE